mmetsp:Transcript_971/g.1371  ORF Transcript_971/g.1371 Transcript_971/m.1371 type:complete len:82 (+) Transcript_971:1048-1293(+)
MYVCVCSACTGQAAKRAGCRRTVDPSCIARQGHELVAKLRHKRSPIKCTDRAETNGHKMSAGVAAALHSLDSYIRMTIEGI